MSWETGFVKLIELIFDNIIVLLSYLVAVFLIHMQGPEYFFSGDDLTLQLSITLGLILFLTIVFSRMYSITMFYGGYIRNVLKIAMSLVFIALIATIFQLLYPFYKLSILPTFLMVPIALIFLMFFKGLFYIFLKKVNVKYALLCGPKGEVEAMAKKLLFDNTKFTFLKYIVYDTFDLEQIEVLQKYIDDVDTVYIAEKLSSKMKNTIISYCFKIKKPFYLVPRLYELALNKSVVSQVGDTLVFGVRGLGLTIEQRFFKRTFDLIFSIILSILLLPFMLIIGLIIKISDRGPIFFKQKRMTRNNRVFILYKFRSMIPDAEKETGAIQAEKNDKRVTRVGKFLRATRLDELPQLINVIIGDMSLVGPRALRVEEMEEFANKDSEFMYRLNVKAGVTGYAQIMGKYYTHFKDKLHFDIFYIVNYSFFNDVVIIFQTLRMIFDPTSSEGVSGKKTLPECLNERGFSYILTLDNSVYGVIKNKSNMEKNK